MKLNLHKNGIQLTSNETQYAPTEIRISRFFLFILIYDMLIYQGQPQKTTFSWPPLPYYLRRIGIAIFHKECYCVGKDPG